MTVPTFDKQRRGMTVTDVPVDESLPQLGVILNSTRMRGVFAETVRETSELDVTDCKILEIRYQPGISCRVTYQLGVWDKRLDKSGTQLICICAFTPGGSVSEFCKARENALVKPTFGPPLIHIPKLSVVGWSFPNDRKLQELKHLIDQRYLRQSVLPELVMKAFGTGWRLDRIDLRLLQYADEKGCVVAIDVEVGHKHPVAQRELRLIAKTYPDDSGVETYRVMRELWNTPGTPAAGMAEPITYDAASRSVWQRALSGISLSHRLHVHSSLAQAAVRVAELHRTTLPVGRRVGMDDLLDELHKTEALLLRVRPQCRRALEKVVEQLHATIPDTRTTPEATLHGDLHLGNILIGTDGAALLDFDDVCSGPVLLDIGSFIACLFYRCIRRDASTLRVETIKRSFLDAYCRAVPWPVCGRTLRWFVALTLITERARGSVTRLKAGRLDVIDALLELAEQQLVERKNFGTL